MPDTEAEFPALKGLELVGLDGESVDAWGQAGHHEGPALVRNGESADAGGGAGGLNAGTGDGTGRGIVNVAFQGGFG